MEQDEALARLIALAGTSAPAAVAALWQPWRRLTLGSGR